MSNSNENSPVTVSIHLGSLTTDGALLPIIHLPKKSKIVSAKLMNGAIVAAHDSNYAQVALKNGSTVVAELDTRAAHENALAANEAKGLNVVEAVENQAAGSNLTLLYNEAGTVALTDAKLILTYYPL